MSTPPPARTAYADPRNVLEGWDDDHDRGVIDSVGWDLSYWTNVVIGFEHPYDDDTGGGWQASVAMADADRTAGIIVRSVTADQVRAYARHLVELVDRVEAARPQPVAPDTPAPAPRTRNADPEENR